MVVMTRFAPAVNQLVPLHSQRVYNASFFSPLKTHNIHCWYRVQSPYQNNSLSFSSFWENTKT